ncbi:MAG: TIR domain-containing protein [Chloroflexota bacterium]
MPHDIFISHSSKDKLIADGICANLEAAGLRCWIAPRDIAAGEEWPKAITNAISKSRVMVLVFSANSNASSDVGREIVLAASNNLVIIPFKIENIEPEAGKKYYLAQTHWLEAMNPPTREQIQTLVETVRSVVSVVVPEGIVRSEPIGMPPSVKPLPVLNKRSNPWYLWVIGLLILFLLVVLFWPKIQGVFYSPSATPTLAATETPQPSSTVTSSPTATATETLLPSATPTTGTVTGHVMWGDQPYEGVDIWVCSEWIGSCKGDIYRLSDTGLSSDAQGAYTISGIEPGNYTVIPRVPGQLNISIPGEETGEIMVSAGETIVLDNFFLCKYDMNVTISVQNGRVSLHWNAIPAAEFYDWSIRDIYWSKYSMDRIQTTSGTSDYALAPGNYIYFVSEAAYDGRCHRGIGHFTIP